MKVIFLVCFLDLSGLYVYVYDPLMQDKGNIVLPNFCSAIPDECSECGHKSVMGGPIWSNPIHDKEWAVSILSNVHAMSNMYPAYAKISAILTSVSEVMPYSSSVHNKVMI